MALEVPTRVKSVNRDNIKMTWRKQHAKCVAKVNQPPKTAPHSAASVKEVNTSTLLKMFVARAPLDKLLKWECKTMLAFSALPAKPQTPTTQSATHVSSGAMGPHDSFVTIALSGSIKMTRGRLIARTAASIAMVWPCLTNMDSSAQLCQTLSVSLARRIQTKRREESLALTPKMHACAQRQHFIKQKTISMIQNACLVLRVQIAARGTVSILLKLWHYPGIGEPILMETNFPHALLAIIH